MDRRAAAANGADQPRLLSAPGRCYAARNTRSGRRATSGSNDANASGRPTNVCRASFQSSANQADSAALTSALDTVESQGCSAADPHRWAQKMLSAKLKMKNKTSLPAILALALALLATSR